MFSLKMLSLTDSFVLWQAGLPVSVLALLSFRCRHNSVLLNFVNLASDIKWPAGTSLKRTWSIAWRLCYPGGL
jgi:hypothetical protein